MRKLARFITPLLIGLLGLSGCKNSSNSSSLKEISLNYKGNTTILENTSIEFNPLFNNNASFNYSNYSLISSDENIAAIEGNKAHFKNIINNQEVTITIKDNASNLLDSISFYVVDVGFKDGEYLNKENYIDDGYVSILNENAPYYLPYERSFTKSFYFEINIKTPFGKEGDRNGIVYSSYEDPEEFGKNTYFFHLTYDYSTTAAYAVVERYDPESKSFDSTSPVIKEKLVEPISFKNYFYKLSIFKYGDNCYFYISSSNKERQIIGNVKNTTMNSDLYLYFYSNSSKSVQLKNYFSRSEDEGFEEAYISPDDIEVQSRDIVVKLNDTVKIEVIKSKTSLILDENLKFASSNPEIATVTDEGKVTGVSLGSCVVTLMYRGTNIVKTINIRVTRNVDDRVTLDLKMDEPLYTENVRKNNITLYGNENNSFSVSYASLTSDGIVLFTEVYFNQIKNDGNGWWERDNFEIRFGTSSKLSSQIWFSVLNQGSSNTANSVVSNILKDTSNQRNYKFVVEALFTWDNLSSLIGEPINYDTKVFFSIGFNDAKGWKACDWFGKSDANTPYVTFNGFARGNDVLCTSRHEECSTTIKVLGTCSKEETTNKVCKYCGIPMTVTKTGSKNANNHHYDPKNIVYTVEPYCHQKGQGTVKCEDCNKTINVTTDEDLTKHVHNGEELLENPVHISKGQGLNAPNAYKAFTTTSNSKHHLVIYQNGYRIKQATGENRAWETMIPAICDSTNLNNNVTFRLDWWGWTNGNFNENYLNKGSVYIGQHSEFNNFEIYMPMLHEDCYIELDVIRQNKLFTLNYEIIANNTMMHNTRYTYTQSYDASHLSINDFTLVLDGENVEFDVLSIKKVS